MLWNFFSAPGEPAYDLTWAYFIRNSPYSPFNLAYLRQPRPSDLPADSDVSLFTFTDAFEDLLAVAASKPLPPIESRVSLHNLLRQVFPSGETPAFWIQRLSSNKLLTPTSVKTLISDEWDTPLFGTPLSGTLSSLDHADHFRREFQKAARRAILSDEDMKKAGDDMQDLTEVWTSFFDSGVKSFGTFVNLIKDGNSGLQSSFDVDSHSNGSVTIETPRGNGTTKTIESKDEYIDWMGMLHTKHTTKVVDENGKVLSSQSHWSMTNNYDKEKYKELTENKGNKDGKPRDW